MSMHALYRWWNWSLVISFYEYTTVKRAKLKAKKKKKKEANELRNNHSHIHSLFKIIRDMYYLMVYTHCALKNVEEKIKTF